MIIVAMIRQDGKTSIFEGNGTNGAWKERDDAVKFAQELLDWSPAYKKAHILESVGVLNK